MTAVSLIGMEVPPPGDDGYAYVQIEGGERIGWHVHDDARVAWAKPAWANGKLLIHIMGGTAPEAGFEEEGTAFLIDPAALLALTDALFSLAFDAEPDTGASGS